MMYLLSPYIFLLVNHQSHFSLLDTPMVVAAGISVVATAARPKYIYACLLYTPESRPNLNEVQHLKVKSLHSMSLIIYEYVHRLPQPAYIWSGSLIYVLWKGEQGS